MKRIFTAVCALALLMAGCTPALAAEAPELSAPPTQEPERSCYYPVKVDEYTAGPLDELRIDKVYQLSLGDDPSGIPTEDFTRNGRLYYLLDMVRKDEVGVDTQTHTETVTLGRTPDCSIKVHRSYLLFKINQEFPVAIMVQPATVKFKYATFLVVVLFSVLILILWPTLILKLRWYILPTKKRREIELWLGINFKRRI